MILATVFCVDWREVIFCKRGVAVIKAGDKGQMRGFAVWMEERPDFRNVVEEEGQDLDTICSSFSFLRKEFIYH